MATIGKYEEPRRTDKEYIENEARERVRAARRSDSRHGYDANRAIFKTDDVKKWRNEDYCLYMRFVSEVAAEIGFEMPEDEEELEEYEG